MLPKQTAIEITSKKRVAPEKIESVTIYFSDIVDFSEMVRTNSPIEVRDLDFQDTVQF